jgi:hypothetical protein
MTKEQIERYGNNGLDGIQLGDGICSQCQRLNSFTGKPDSSTTCQAFPNGIPADILNGTIQHTHSVEGDNGIFYKPNANARDIAQFPYLKENDMGKEISLN